MIFGDERAFVVDVENAVAIVVRFGATVFILKVIEVFRIIRALIDVIFVAIAIAIAKSGGSKMEAEAEAYLRGVDALDHASCAASNR